MTIAPWHGSFYLNKPELQQFHHGGYIGPFHRYLEQEMADLLQKLKPKRIENRHAIYNQSSAISSATSQACGDRHLDVDFLADHIMRREIVDRASSISGSDTPCWRSECSPEYPGDEGADWHQADDFSNAAGLQHPQIPWSEDPTLDGVDQSILEKLVVECANK
jgi:non-haem Fe2+, alpha-ketoglutarate-dependent halogenase